MAFLQRSCSVETLAHAAVLVQENFAVLLDPVQHLWDGGVETDGGVFELPVLISACMRGSGFVVPVSRPAETRTAADADEGGASGAATPPPPCVDPEQMRKEKT